MKPEEYLTYFEDFIFFADKESGQKNPFEGCSKKGPPKRGALSDAVLEGVSGLEAVSKLGI